ncbi:hypothetical protein EBZ39_13775 [bacterium]|nr:hypothetical protein [bacterium]
MDIKTLRDAFNNPPQPVDFEPNPWNKVACRQYAKGKNIYAVCIRRVGNLLCWDAYRMVTNIDGRSACRFWKRIPCFTGAEYRRFPKHLARAAQAFLDEYKEKVGT